MLHQRDEMDRVDRMALGRAEMSVSSKRMGEEQDMSSTRRSKRRKYQLLEKDWGMSGEETHNNFLYSGLEGVRRIEEVDRNPSYKRKSGKDRSLERAAKDNHKLSEWILKQDVNMMNNMEGLSNDPFSTGEYMVQAECVKNLDVGGKAVSHEVCAENNDNENSENSVIESVDTKTTSIESKNVNKKKTKVWTKLQNGLFGWRVIRTGVRKTSSRKQTEAKLGQPILEHLTVLCTQRSWLAQPKSCLGKIAYLQAILRRENLTNLKTFNILGGVILPRVG